MRSNQYGGTMIGVIDSTVAGRRLHNAMKLRKKDSESGFTLIEIIITIVIIGVVAAVLLSYFSAGIIKSANPTFSLQQSTNLEQIMGKITFYYSNPPYWQAGSYAPGSEVMSTKNSGQQGFQYYTTGGGTSGSTEPSAWPTPQNSSSITDPSTGGATAITWNLNTTTCPPPLSGTSCPGCPYTCPTSLQKAIGAEGTSQTIAGGNLFGNYTVTQNHFIVCNQQTETASSNPTLCLKVTIGPPANAYTSQTLSTVFTAR